MVLQVERRPPHEGDVAPRHEAAGPARRGRRKERHQVRPRAVEARPRAKHDLAPVVVHVVEKGAPRARVEAAEARRVPLHRVRGGRQPVLVKVPRGRRREKKVRRDRRAVHDAERKGKGADARRRAAAREEEGRVEEGHHRVDGVGHRREHVEHRRRRRRKPPIAPPKARVERRQRRHVDGRLEGDRHEVVDKGKGKQPDGERCQVAAQGGDAADAAAAHVGRPVGDRRVRAIVAVGGGVGRPRSAGGVGAGWSPRARHCRPRRRRVRRGRREERGGGAAEKSEGGGAAGSSEGGHRRQQ
ncbi:hypothetical protein BU14_0224s0010 [Porphyra umbilicalis]|uniref:Uncharacterized protein n=1 Tax=Porphyra umbilicalis TaxID=2786 RepID=A0A1X6P4B9_PORUM|nr:hypothetical protein BU14_0224s0010 [Porphyra umbilicalis]|eukprot:OSX75712.1 hypothetical protein BU14_0224s0010 [Porphyra umbilicalis]